MIVVHKFFCTWICYIETDLPFHRLIMLWKFNKDENAYTVKLGYNELGC